jgi:hypothetical protein
MTDTYAYSGLALNGKYSDDGEYFQLYLDLDGVPIRFGNIYVGDQREAFTDAKNASQPKSEEDKPAKK